MRTKELEERAADIASPRPPLNNSIQDQMVRDLYDRVEALESAGKPKGPVDLPFTLAPRK
jgi:hypothetical protein